MKEKSDLLQTTGLLAPNRPPSKSVWRPLPDPLIPESKPQPVPHTRTHTKQHPHTHNAHPHSHARTHTHPFSLFSLSVPYTHTQTHITHHISHTHTRTHKYTHSHIHTHIQIHQSAFTPVSLELKIITCPYTFEGGVGDALNTEGFCRKPNCWPHSPCFFECWNTGFSAQRIFRLFRMPFFQGCLATSAED